MLTLLLGKDWVRNLDTILNMVAEDVAAGKNGRVLLVPELISHDIERRLCAAAGDTATLHAEVVTFTRMVRAVSDCAGKGIDPCLDNGGRLVAMAATTRQLSSVLKAYASLETKPEFLTELVSAVDEFKQCCITSHDLAKAASCTEGSFAQKLEELALILDAYDGICRQGKRDPADQMNWVLEQMEDCTYAQERVFYVDGFPDFTRQHMLILQHIILHSNSVIVSLNCDKPNSVDMAFEKPGKTAAYLLRFAKEQGIPVEIKYIDEEETSLAAVRAKLYRGETDLDLVLQDCLCAYHAGSVYQECVAAAQEIRSKIKNGNRYRDISVVCGDMNAYKSTLTMVFRRFGIPLYISGTENILDKPVISALLATVDAALGGMEKREVLNYLKSVICPVDTETCDAIENYAMAWSVQGSMWTREWTMHPEGIAKKWHQRDYDHLAQLNAAREQAIAPLASLRDAFLKAQNMKQQVAAVYRFMEEIQLSDTFQKLANSAEQVGDHRNAQIFNQLWEILMCALEQMHDVLGDTIWDADTFSRLLRLLLSQYDIGTIPPVLDAVVAGPVSAMRCQQCQHLLVIGADEGCMPAYCNSAGVLTEKERVALRDLGVSLKSAADDGLQGEFYELYGVFCGARASVYLSAGPGQPSFVFRRLAKLCGGERSISETPSLYIGDKTDAVSYLVRTGTEIDAVAPDLQEDYVRLKDACDYALGYVTPESVRAVYGDVLYLSPSSVNLQAKCRLQYFLRYGMKAKELRPFTVDPAEFGTYVHDVLENTAKEVMRRGGFHKVMQEETLEIASEYSNKYITDNFSQIESVRQSYLLKRNQAELFAVVEELWQEMSKSQFVPTYFELAFGNGQQLSAIPIEEADMPALLNGKVDRVDIYQDREKNYFRVVDYKTGREALDYCDIQNGVGLQMLLYLFALEDMGKPLVGENSVPAGVLYFPARVEVLNFDTPPTAEEADKERQKKWKRSSLLLADSEILAAMCEDLQKIGLKINKDGSVSGDLVSTEQLKTLKEYIRGILAKLVNEIASGNVDANPYYRGEMLNACQYCPYKSVCHPQENAQFRALATTSFSAFWEKLEMEMSDHG